MSTDAAKAPGPDEALKRGSRFLRGTIPESLADPATGAVSEGDAKLLKFHGTYQQDDRDLRLERMEQKLEPDYQFMVRIRMPAGICQPAQWLVLDALAREHGSGSLRITTRQTFQLHGVRKKALKKTIAGINHAGLSTVAACGDVNRNVVCHSNPHLSPLNEDVSAMARALSAAFEPGTGAYAETWLDAEPKPADDEREEPLYGPTYLPRKFKIGITIPPYNDIDVFAQDLGFIAIADDGGTLAGFNVAVGGGMGMSHNEPATYPRTGDVIGFCEPEQVIPLSREVIGIQRDHGDRSDRKHARFKYTIDDRGLDWFTAELTSRLGWPLPPARDYTLTHNSDPEGWAQGADGNWHLTLNVLSGRIAGPLMEALREIAETHTGDFRMTTNQNVTIARIPAAMKEAIAAILDRHGIDHGVRTKPLRRDAMSCVALPTCGLAMAESERMLPDFLDALADELAPIGLGDAPLTVRVTGCPNGCGRPYLAEIALVGKSLGRYDLFVGGDAAGTRMNRLYARSLTIEEVLETLRPMLARYASERDNDERFGDFVVRAGYVVPVVEAREFNRD